MWQSPFHRYNSKFFNLSNNMHRNLMRKIYHVRNLRSRYFEDKVRTTRSLTFFEAPFSSWKGEKPIKKNNSIVNAGEQRYLHVTFSNNELIKKSNCDDSQCIDKPLKWPSGQKATRFNFHEDIEKVMNDQINAEMKAFYYYLSMAAYFGRVDVALPGCESFFMQMHDEEHEHALRFLNYVKMRGGMVELCPVMPPSDQDWKCPIHAFKTALQLEIEVSEKLVNANTAAEKHGDLNASDFIVTGFMENQMKSINEMARFVTILSGIGDQALARFMFDKDLLENYVMPNFNVFKNKCHTTSCKN